MPIREDPLIRSRDVISRAAAALSNAPSTGAPARAKLQVTASITNETDLLNRSRASARAEAGAAAAARTRAAEAEALVMNSRRRLVQLARLAREALGVVDSSWGNGGVNGGNRSRRGSCSSCSSSNSSPRSSSDTSNNIFSALRLLSLEADEPIEDATLPFAVGAPVRARAKLAAAAAQRGGTRVASPFSPPTIRAPNDKSLLAASDAICERLEEFARAEIAHHAILRA